MPNQPVLIAGEWKASQSSNAFQAINPATREPHSQRYPVSPWSEIEQSIHAAAAAYQTVRDWPGERFARFLDRYASAVEQRAAEIIAAANAETALPVEPRLKNAEFPRTVNQLRQAAAAAEEGSWALPTIDTKANIRSMFGSIGPVAVFGPNNFPLAFNSIAGGDFAAAVAAGNPVIAKGHSSHPRTTQLLAEAAHEASLATEMPPGFVQLIYRTDHEDGAKLVAHPLIGACGYTGGRTAGLVIKQAADRAGKPAYLELSSINPVVILPGALEERFQAIVDDYAGSALMGAGQFCTNPGLVILLEGRTSEEFIAAVGEKFKASPSGTLLGEGVEKSLKKGIAALLKAGAEVVVGNTSADPRRCCYANTLLRASGTDFLMNPHGLQEEAFGNCGLVVVARNIGQVEQIALLLEGNLTGCIYSATNGKDDSLYNHIAPALRQRVGRLLNDKMPTGVAVSPAMNHGGPYPATGHPGFTAVGIPASLRRFAMLHCYDNVRNHRLPPSLRNQNPGNTWRLVDGAWTQANIG